jgi:hypothetical protein
MTIEIENKKDELKLKDVDSESLITMILNGISNENNRENLHKIIEPVVQRVKGNPLLSGTLLVDIVNYVNQEINKGGDGTIAHLMFLGSEDFYGKKSTTDPIGHVGLFVYLDQNGQIVFSDEDGIKQPKTEKTTIFKDILTSGMSYYTKISRTIKNGVEYSNFESITESPHTVNLKNITDSFVPMVQYYLDELSRDDIDERVVSTMNDSLKYQTVTQTFDVSGIRYISTSNRIKTENGWKWQTNTTEQQPFFSGGKYAMTILGKITAKNGINVNIYANFRPPKAGKQLFKIPVVENLVRSKEFIALTPQSQNDVLAMTMKNIKVMVIGSVRNITVSGGIINLSIECFAGVEMT